MATPQNDSYSGSSGAVIRGGRSASRRVSIWGQSNAVGRASRSDISASPLSSDPGLAAYDAGTFSRVYIWTGSVYAQLQPSVNNGANAGQFGAEFGLAVRWMRETVGGNLYIDKQAVGGVSITYFDPAGANYIAMRSARTSANSWLATNGIVLTDAGMLWVQGESDAGQTQSWYQTRMENLIAARLADGFQSSTAENLLVQMVPGSATYDSNIVAAKAAIASANPGVTYAPAGPPYMQGDNLHQNGRGQVQLGYDAFEVFFNAPHIST